MTSFRTPDFNTMPIKTLVDLLIHRESRSPDLIPYRFLNKLEQEGEAEAVPAYPHRSHAARPHPAAPAVDQRGLRGHQGVMLSHRNLLYNANIKGNVFNHDEVGVSWLPLYHDLGFRCGRVLPLCDDSRRRGRAARRR